MDFLRPLTVAFVSKGSGQIFDDWADRLNHVLSVGLYILFVFIVGLRQYVGEPIQCWCPAQFTSNYIDYTNKVCWVSNTYYIPMGDEIPKNISLKPHLTYYQWTPFILAFMALLFVVPYIVWRSLVDRSGMFLGSLITTAAEYSSVQKLKDREKMVKQMVKHIDYYVDFRDKCARNGGKATCGALRNIFNRICCLAGRRYGGYMVRLYLFCKVLYCFNSIGQLFLMNAFLGKNFNMYGFNVISSLSSGTDLGPSEFFPLVTLCDFFIREIGIHHRYTVQCVLQVNLFNEKIFIFIWFWLFLVCVINVYSLVRWIMKVAFRSDRAQFLKRFLKVKNCLRTNADREKLKEFVTHYLKEDGVFTLRMLSANSSDLIVTDVVEALFENMRDYRPHRDMDDQKMALNGDNRQ